MSTESWLTLFAIVVGPLSAVLVTFWLQKRDQLRGRQVYIFRVLMATRKTPLDRERIQALNLIEVDFQGNTKVLDAYKDLVRTYDDRRYKSENRDEIHQAVDDSSAASANLIYEIAKSLGYSVQQLDALRGGYVPQAFGTLEDQQYIMRDFVVRLALGEQSLPVRFDDEVHAEKSKSKNGTEIPPSPTEGG